MSMALPPVIETRGLVKRYGDQIAVAGVDLVVGPAEIFGLVGPNGAGKTTMMKVLATLLAPTAGEARVCGISVMEDPIEVRRRIRAPPDDHGASGASRGYRCCAQHANRELAAKPG